VIEQGYGLPEPEVLQAILNRHAIRDEAGYRRDYISEHGARPGLEIDLAFIAISSNNIALSLQPDGGAKIDQDRDIWAEPFSLINNIVSYF
jgi:hypothetical protein